MRVASGVLMALFAACRAAPAQVGGAAMAPPSSLPEAYVPAFQALTDAVEDHQDVVARRILDQLLGRLLVDRERLRSSAAAQPQAESELERHLGDVESALKATRAFDRILTGRSWVAGLSLELEASFEQDERQAQVFLRVSGRERGALILAPGPGTLTVQSSSLSPDGHELHNSWTTHTSDVQNIAVDGDGVAEIPLGSFPVIVPPETLAVRVRWGLELRSGEVRVGQEGYPAMGFQVKPCRVERLAPFLPTDAVEPAELVRYVREGGTFMPALLERAVRIAPERRSEALDGLAPLVAAASKYQLELLAPALRWLTDRDDPRSGPIGWKNWFRSRARDRDGRKNLQLGRADR